MNVLETLRRALADRSGIGRKLRRGGIAARVAVPLLAMGVASACDFDRHRWRTAQAADSVPAYESFLARSPRSAYADSARERIAQLQIREAATAFRAAAAQNTVNGYRQFVHRSSTVGVYNPSLDRRVRETYAAYVDSAEARVDELEFQEAEATNTFGSYWHYVLSRTKPRSARLDSAIARMVRAPAVPGDNVRGLVVQSCNGRPVVEEGYRRYAVVFPRLRPGDMRWGHSFRSVGGGLGMFLFSLEPGEYLVFQNDEPGGFFFGTGGGVPVRVAPGQLADFRMWDARCADIRLIAPENGTRTSERPQFEWEPYRDGARYQVVVDGDADTGTRVSPQTFETRVQLAEPLSPGAHAWQVCVVGDRTRSRRANESHCSFENRFAVVDPKERIPVP